MDLSFSGAGFMGCYYFGVVDCWNKYIPRDRVNRVAGASAGSLIAAYYLLDLPLDSCLKCIIDMTEDIRRRPLGVFDRNNQIVDILPRLLDTMFPDDAHKKVSGRLHVVMTRLKDMKKIIVNEFETRQELIDALNCSCFIPVWSGNHISTYKDVKHIDGGFSDNLPVFDEHTIRVCCFAGATDISPYDRAQKELLSATVLNTPIYFTLTNFKRGKKALFPPSANQIVGLLERGFQDTRDFILMNDLIQCQTCYSRTKLHEQPIYLKKSPIITPSVSPALSRACSHSNLPAGAAIVTNALTKEAGNEENEDDGDNGQLDSGAKKRAPSLESESETSSQEQPSFNVLLREKLREEKDSQQQQQRSKKNSSKRSRRETTDANNNKTAEAAVSDREGQSAQQQQPVIVVVEEPAGQKKDAKETLQRSPEEERKADSKKGCSAKDGQEKQAKVPPPAALSEKLLLRRGTIQMDPEESLKIGLDKFTLAPNPLPSCPPSPNLNRHCKQCISMRQEARLDLLDEKIRREVDKYCTPSPVRLNTLASRLAHPIKWFRQLGVRSSYRFEEVSGLRQPTGTSVTTTTAN